MKARGDKVRRPVTVGVTDATYGRKEVIDLDKLDNIDDVLMWTKASTSIPALFQSMKIDGKIYIDGGVVQNLDVGAAVRRCNELGFSDENIVIDVV